MDDRVGAQLSLKFREYPIHIIRATSFEESLYRAVDVCKAIGLNPKGTGKICSRLYPDERTHIYEKVGRGPPIKVTYLTGPGLLHLLTSCRVRTTLVLAFQRWVFHEVLPAIVDSGKYEVPEKSTEPPKWLKSLDEGKLLSDAELPQGKGGMVYFIEAPSTGLVKIGKTTDLEERFKSLCTMSPTPLRLLKVIPGYSDEEKTLHKRFKEYRRHGEWFELEPLRRAIRGL